MDHLFKFFRYIIESVDSISKDERGFLAAASLLLCSFLNVFLVLYIIESVDSISKDERGFPLTQYITNGRISRGGYTFTHFKHHHRVLRLISYSMVV